MLEEESGRGSKGWREFIKDHWKLFCLIVVGVIIASVGAILVFLWLVGNAQSTGMVPMAIGLWTMGNLVNFLLNLIFWEVLLIGVPVILVVITILLWWKRLPQESKIKYRFFGTRSRNTSGGNAVSFLVFIAFCIKVFLDGNWNVSFSTWTFNYFVYSILTALIWVLIIFGIPIALGIIWWIHHEVRIKP
jgi:hypothetical protein